MFPGIPSRIGCQLSRPLLLLLLLSSLAVIGCGHAEKPGFYRPYQGKGDLQYSDEGVASWYGRPFHGRRTASGERYNMNEFTCAHRSLPFGAMLRVQNIANGREVIVKVNDRGPFVKDRLIDVSRAAAKELAFEKQGTTRVRVEWIDDPMQQPLARSTEATDATQENHSSHPSETIAELISENSEEISIDE